MIFQKRPDAPDCLTVENQEKWGKQWVALKAKNPRAVFQWYSYEKQKVNTIVEPFLREMSNDHCAFCDGFPLQTTGVTIEHFKPKSTFPLLSHTWDNLFYCCHQCQKKGEYFDEKLLKPDDKSYRFSHFFIYKTVGNGIFLHPNPKGTAEEQERAEITINLYGLNKFGRPDDRYRVLKQYHDSNNPIIEEFSYRYLFDLNL